jgi:hypothetical protein
MIECNFGQLLRTASRTFTMSQRQMEIFTSFFKKGKLMPYPVEKWVQDAHQKEGVVELHETLEGLARQIETSSISSLQEFNIWVESVLTALVG